MMGMLMPVVFAIIMASKSFATFVHDYRKGGLV